MKASPLIVLDEVDTALDESNVVRFGQFLKRYSRDTQFMVITHQKATMEAADLIYGLPCRSPGLRIFGMRSNNTRHLKERFHEPFREISSRTEDFRKLAGSRVGDIRLRRVTPEFLDDLEEVLIQSDVGVQAAMALRDRIQEENKKRNLKTPDGSSA